MKYITSILGFLLLHFPVIGQQEKVIEQAIKDVRYLSSKEMMGRGYQYGGHKKAAAYLQKEFKRIGILPLKDSYYQKFTLEVNSVYTTPFLKINGKKLLLGKEFLPHANSASGGSTPKNSIVLSQSGLYIPAKKINDFQGQYLKDAILVMKKRIPKHLKQDTSIQKNYFEQSTRVNFVTQQQAKAVLFLTEKLTYRSASKRLSLPIFEILKTSFPKKVKQISYKIKTKIKTYTSQNVIGYLPGTNYQDSTIIVCAHYDHLGALSPDIFFPGANDNASGVSLVLNLARFFKKHPVKYSMIFILFSGEEMGLVGSKYFLEHPLVDLNKIKFLLNFDMVASGEQGLKAVGGKDYPNEFNKLKKINSSLKLGIIGSRQNAPNSDQYFFLKNGVKGFFIYTSHGKQPYHHIQDREETLEWDDYFNVYKLATTFIKKI